MKKLNTKVLKAFFVYTIALALFTISIYFSLDVYKNRNLYFGLIKSYSLIEFLLISYIVFLLTKLPIIRIIIISISFFVIIYLCFNFFEKDQISFSKSYLVSSFALIIFILFFFYSKMRLVSSYPIYQTITFWIFVGYFIFYTGNILFFLVTLSNLTQEVKVNMSMIYGIIAILKNTILCTALFANELNIEQEANLNIPDDLNLDDYSENTN